MAWISLLSKDVREHFLAFLLLLMGFLLVLLLVLEQNRAGSFSLSGLQVVRFSLVTVIPLITFIVGNRLVAREYVGGTRHFVEALPIRPVAQLLQKYFMGLVYLFLTGAILVVIARASSSASEMIDQRYMLLVLIRTLAIIWLYWSIVFCFSFTGRVRLVLYVGLALALMFLINLPGFDQTRLGPIALMDSQLFSFERTEIPWQDLIETGLLAMAFTLAAFFLALVNEGSLVERLSKPITMRDIAALGLLALGCFGVYATVQEKWKTEYYAFSGDTVLRSSQPALSVMFLNEAHRPIGNGVMQSATEIIERFQTDIGLSNLPAVRIALDTEREKNDVSPRLVNGVLVYANFLDFDEYELANLNFIAMHHLLLEISNRRFDYESRHWILDGLARWWTEGGADAPVSDNNDELLALAVFAKSRLPNTVHPLHGWQTVTDKLGYELANALSYTALLYLQSLQGPDVLFQLASDYLSEDVKSSSVESVFRIFHDDLSRFERITGISFEDFTEGWLAWLTRDANTAAVQSLFEKIPDLAVNVESVRDNSVHRFDVSYASNEPNYLLPEGKCVLRHQYHSAFDEETEMREKERDRHDCAMSPVHGVDAAYAPGDRAYVVVEYESDYFHNPIPLWIGRVNIK